MQLDLQQLVQRLDRVLPSELSLRSPSSALRAARDLVDNFIKGFYVPEEQFDFWARDHTVCHILYCF